MYCHTSSSVQLEIGNTRTCSPLRIRALNSDHSSGRWRLGSHWPKSSRKENIRSLARARSSSRRAPPKAASKPCSSIASSSVVVCRRLRDARGPVSSTTRPASIESWTLATISRSPSWETIRSRNSITSGKLCPVSTCMIGNGNFPGRNAFSARRSRMIESLPPLNSSTGRSNSAATSRKMWIDSASRDLEMGELVVERVHEMVTRRSGSPAQTWIPHSVLSWPVQRPSRPEPGSVHGAQPIEAYP